MYKYLFNINKNDIKTKSADVTLGSLLMTLNRYFLTWYLADIYLLKFNSGNT